MLIVVTEIIQVTLKPSTQSFVKEYITTKARKHQTVRHRDIMRQKLPDYLTLPYTETVPISGFLAPKNLRKYY